MLRVFTGRFHPHLESALVDHIRSAKADDPFAPIAVLVPSSSLLDRVRRLLALEQHLSLLNVHFFTFHQLALRLADETRGQSQVAPPRVVDDLVFEQLIRHIFRSRLSSLAPLRHIGHSSGTWGALWSTIRDLKDAGVDPSAAVRGLDEGCFEKEDEAWLHALFSLHAAVKDVGRTLEVGTPDDLAESLIPLVPTLAFLTTLRQVFYYGFYDLTQVQLSLFEAVSKTAPTTLFFPLDEGASYGFSRRFFDRYILPCVTRPDALSNLTDVRSPVRTTDAGPVTLFLRSVIGMDEELATTCRTILDLVETNGYQFDDIGVVARTLDPYRTHLKSAFDRHGVPFVTNAGRPLMQEPACKVLLQLASLPLNEFYRATVLDVVTSPLYATTLCDEASAHYRPEQWKLIVPALQITRGIEEWQRLEQASRSALELDGGDEERSAIGSLDIAPEVIGLLWRVVSQLLADCASLPPQGTIGQLVDALQNLVSQHLHRPQRDHLSDEDPGRSRLVSTWEGIDQTWAQLRELESIGEVLTWADFVELLTHALDRMIVPLDAVPHRGVMVLDVMAARGLPFKALFVLGLNEKVFPRYIREDAFLRDRHRRVLETTLGFKIDEKLIGYEEESLLFTLLCQAASQRLYLSFQRADDAGRMLAPSPYLSEACRQFGIDQSPIEAVPRRLTDRVAQQPSVTMFLPPADLTQWMAMTGQDPVALLEAVERDAESFRHAMKALERIEDDRPTLNPFDGLTGTLDQHWSRLLQRGVAPTPLERYARCPFQYFAADVLRLEPLRLPIEQGPDAALLGTLCHAALRRCYEQLVATGWPAERVPDDAIVRYVHSAVEQAAVECAARHHTGHYLLWELAKAQIVELVTAAVEADEMAQSDDPYMPIAFEVDAEGTLLTTDHVPLKIHGRVDRIDRHRDSGVLRMIDYKFKVGSAMKTEDRNLVQSAIRGYRLQPPLYACLNIPGQPQASQVQFVFLAPLWSVPIARSTFETAVWASAIGELVRKTIDMMVTGIQSGRYFIVPDNYCDTCAFRIACRREHTPTWWRAYRADESKAFKAVRAQRIKDE